MASLPSYTRHGNQAVEELKKKINVLLPLFWSIKSIIQMIMSPFSLSVFAAMLLQLPPNWYCQWPSFFNMNEISVKWKELPRRACMPSTGSWHIQNSVIFNHRIGQKCLPMIWFLWRIIRGRWSFFICDFKLGCIKKNFVHILIGSWDISDRGEMENP